MSQQEGRRPTQPETPDAPPSEARSSTAAVRGPQAAAGAIDRAHLSEEMARSLAAEGRREEAIALYRLLVSERPADHELQQRLEELLGQGTDERARRERPRVSPSATGPYSEPFGMLDLTEPPETYDVDEVEILYKDPWWVFVYWEVTDSGLRAARAQLGAAAESARLVLRVFSWPVPTPGQSSTRELRDVTLTQSHGRRYLEVPLPGGLLRAAVGLLTREGFFASIAHSTQLRLPPPSVSPQVSGEWLHVTPERTRGLRRERIDAQSRSEEHLERAPAAVVLAEAASAHLSDGALGGERSGHVPGSRQTPRTTPTAPPRGGSLGGGSGGLSAPAPRAPQGSEDPEGAAR